TPELDEAEAAGCELVRHKAGRNSVIKARARQDAKRLGWAEIPFGMETEMAVAATGAQVANLPPCKRIVVAVGSGMSLAGICDGLDRAGLDVPVLGVVVGSDPRKRLTKYAPGWQERVELVDAKQPYEESAPAED